MENDQAICQEMEFLIIRLNDLTEVNLTLDVYFFLISSFISFLIKF